MTGRRTTERHLMPRLYVKRGKRLDTYYTIVGRKYLGLGNDRAAAERQLRDLVAGRPVSGSIGELCERYLDHQLALIASGNESALSPGTVEEYRVAFHQWLVPVFGRMAPGDFKPTHAAQYLERMKAKGRAVRANREIAALSSAFSYAMRLGLVDRNPCYGVRRNRETPRSRKPEISEVNAFLELAKSRGDRAYMVALIGLMVALSGRRRSEIMGLTLGALQEAGIRVTGGKVKPGETPREYLVAWSPLLRQLVTAARELPRRIESLHLFPTRHGQAYTDAGFKSSWNRIMVAFEQAGGVRFRAHDLRAFYVTETIEAGDNPETHANPATMHRVYDRRRLVKVKPLA